MRILVTGGANGIGRETTERLVEDHHVAVVDREKTDVECDEFLQGDVSDEEFIREIFSDSQFDVVVNCAGYYELGALEDVGSDTVDEIYSSNVFGPLNVLRNSTEMLRERSGRIVNVASVAGRVTIPHYGIYCSTKHALRSLTEAQRMELHETDVDVVLVEPGAVETGFNRRARDALEKYLPESFYSEKYRDIMDSEINGVSTGKAADVLVRAIEEEHPDRRYTVGWDSKFGPLLKTVLPAFIYEKILRSH